MCVQQYLRLRCYMLQISPWSFIDSLFANKQQVCSLYNTINLAVNLNILPFSDDFMTSTVTNPGLFLHDK